MSLDKEKITNACDALYKATRSIRILTHISWPASVRETFFNNDEQALPVVEYPAFDPQPTFAALEVARKLFQFEPLINDWLEKIARQVETSAKMLSVCGTPKFFEYSSELYGAPTDELTDSESSTLDLAEQFDGLFDDFQDLDLGAPRPKDITAEQLCERMKVAATEMFAAESPDVYVVDELSANALAGPSRVRIRRAAMFSENDVQQLINHEVHVHVATSRNGLNQPLKILAAAHPGTTRTQEGLAVLAEFMTGSMDLDRFRRLADRVIAIQMAVEGADFLEVYQFFCTRTGDDREQAFENTRRVFRGGVMTGGSPFTKDIVYLDGLLRVHNFLRTMVSVGRADCLRLLFCGKLDLEDLPVLGSLYGEGLCRAPEYLPTWASDIRFLLAYLVYSSFLNKVDLVKVKKHYREILDALPEIR